MGFDCKLTVNLNDLVFFVKPVFHMDENDEYTSMTLSMDNIFQGKVLRISGTNDTAITVRVRDVNGDEYEACQEVFSADLIQILNIVSVSAHLGGGQQSFDISKTDWITALTERCGGFIKYPYKISFRFSKDDTLTKVVFSNGNELYKNTIKRCLFDVRLDQIDQFNAGVQYQLYAAANPTEWYTVQSKQIDPYYWRDAYTITKEDI